MEEQILYLATERRALKLMLVILCLSENGYGTTDAEIHAQCDAIGIRLRTQTVFKLLKTLGKKRFVMFRKRRHYILTKTGHKVLEQSVRELTRRPW